jgi:hypothetical protein
MKMTCSYNFPKATNVTSTDARPALAWIEPATKVLALIILIAYVSGFLTVNARHQFYLSGTFGLLSEEYLIAGLWFLTLAIWAGSPGLIFAAALQKSRASLRESSQFQRTGALVVMVAIVLIIAFVILLPLTMLGIELHRTWLPFRALAFIVIGFIGSDLTWAMKSQDRAAIVSRRMPLFLALTAPALIVLFARTVYPSIPAKVGGGQYSRITMIPTEDLEDALYYHGLYPDSTGMVRAYLVLATDHTVVISKTQATGPIVFRREELTSFTVE